MVDLTGKMKNRRRLSGTDLVSRFFALRERAEEIADQKPQCVHRSGRVKVRTGCQTEQPYRFKDVPYSMRVTYMSKILPFITTRWLVLVPSLLEAPLGGHRDRLPTDCLLGWSLRSKRRGGLNSTPSDGMCHQYRCKRAFLASNGQLLYAQGTGAPRVPSMTSSWQALGLLHSDSTFDDLRS